MAKPHAVVVNGYGTTIDLPLGEVYLPKVFRYIERARPNVVIFCGGFTFTHSSQDPSEATTMLRWIKDRMNDELYRSILLRVESRSYTTLGNSLGAADVLKYRVVASMPWRVTHFCEATRAADVIMCDRHAMIDKYQVVESIADITVETASWELADPIKQAESLIYNRLAIKFPSLGLFERKERLRREAGEHRKQAFIQAGK